MKEVLVIIEALESPIRLVDDPIEYRMRILCDHLLSQTKMRKDSLL
jgi:hypothetical protein